MVQDDTEEIDQYVEERASISFRRNRSETESATGGKRISLSTIVGGSRRRTLTVIEGGAVIKEKPEIKTQEEVSRVYCVCYSMTTTGLVSFP